MKEALIFFMILYNIGKLYRLWFIVVELKLDSS